MTKIRILLLFLFISLTSFDGEKIILDPNQIYFTDSGMYVEIAGELFQVDNVNFENEIYTAGGITWVCEKGHRQPLYTYPKCLICNSGPRKQNGPNHP